MSASNPSKPPSFSIISISFHNVDSVEAPIDVQADVSGSVLIPIPVLPTHVQFHFSCFKSRYRADMASQLIDAEVSLVYLMNA